MFVGCPTEWAQYTRFVEIKNNSGSAKQYLP